MAQSQSRAYVNMPHIVKTWVVGVWNYHFFTLMLSQIILQCGLFDVDISRVCCRVEARAVVGCWTSCSMYASWPSIATRSNHNILPQYRLTCICQVFVFVYYFYILSDECEILYTIHKGYFIMWNLKEVMDVFSNFGCYFGIMQISAHTHSRGQGHYCNLLTKHPLTGTIRSNF